MLRGGGDWALGAREGRSTRVPVLWLPQSSRPLSPPLSQVSAPGGLRAEGRGQRLGEERGVVAALPWICRAARFGLDLASDMSFFKKI